MIFIKNKYHTWYFSIIEAAKQVEPTGYYEKHHIIPRSLGGDNSEGNVVKLTARQHFICHLLLTKITTGRSKHLMAYALAAMSMKNKYTAQRRFNSHFYEYRKKLLSEANKARRGPHTGMKHTPEAIKKMSLAKLGVKRKPYSKETRAKLSKATTEWYKHNTRSEETLRKISKGNKGKKHTEETKKVLSKKMKSYRATYGFSEEHRRKISESLKNRPVSDTARVNMSAAAYKRKPMSEETKRKMAESQRRRRNKERLSGSINK